MVLSFPKDHGQKRHADEHPVANLAEIGGAGVFVHFRVDFIDSGQGMKNGDVFFQTFARNLASTT